MLFSTFILITVERKHNRLQECIYFCQTDKATQSCDMPRLALKQKEEVGVLLQYMRQMTNTLGNGELT